MVAHKGLFTAGRVLRLPRPGQTGGSGSSGGGGDGGGAGGGGDGGAGGGDEGPSMMTVDFPQATVDMLPRVDAKWRFKSCAIVGNSGGLLAGHSVCVSTSIHATARLKKSASTRLLFFSRSPAVINEKQRGIHTTTFKSALDSSSFTRSSAVRNTWSRLSRASI